MNAPRHEEKGTDSRELVVQGGIAMIPATLYGEVFSKACHDTLVVFFHGGAFVDDKLCAAEDLLKALAASKPGVLILAPRYTLAAASAFPAAIEDAHAVLIWAKANKAAIGWSGKQLVVAGIEAGANLATVSNLMAHDRRGPSIAGQILITPMIDATLSTDSMRVNQVDNCETAYRCYLPHAADRMHPYASPLQSSRLKHMAPALIISAEGDPLRDEAEKYGARLHENGVGVRVRRLPVIPFDHANALVGAAVFLDVLHEASAFLARI